jgi:branched-chain amino acid transport system ATP-binding protein
VLKDISFAVGPGEIVALIGTNGADKTTTLSSVSDLVRPQSGRILWKGADIQGTPSSASLFKTRCRILPVAVLGMSA